jgi:hypothetical protein
MMYIAFDDFEDRRDVNVSDDKRAEEPQMHRPHLTSRGLHMARKIHNLKQEIR